MRTHLLHVTQSGSGPTLVLLHGYASSQQYFKHIRPRLNRYFTVVTLDLLGFGRSPKPRGAYTYDDHVAAVKNTLDRLGISDKPYILLGHSMGALIAARYAVQHPSTISKLILFNPPLFTSAEQMAHVHQSTGFHYRALFYSSIRRVYWRLLKLLPRTGIKTRHAFNIADALRMTRHSRENSYANLIGKSTFFDDIAKTTMPVLFVNGRYDRAVYLQNLQGRTFPANVTRKTVETGHHTLVRNIELGEQLIHDFTSDIIG